MKRTIILFAFLVFVQSLFACDICGCSSGNLFTGPYPFFNKHFVGMRHSVRNYFSRMADDPTEFSKDRYQTTEIWGGLSIGKRWQVMAFVPYNFNRQEMETHPHAEKGVGDITLLGNYQLVNKKNNQLLIGGGIKLPTGKFNPGFAHHPSPSANVQPGSGSVDFIINATHVLHLNKWSVYSNANYKLNGQRKEFRFGNRVNATALLSRSIGAKKMLNPYAGVQYERLHGNKYKTVVIEDTGGQALLGTAGIDIQLGKINIGMNMQLPVAQNFSNTQTDVQWRGMVQVGWVF